MFEYLRMTFNIDLKSGAHKAIRALLLIIILPVSMLTIAGCSDTLDGNESPLPYFDIECSVASYALCDASKDGSEVFIGMTPATNISTCESLLLKPSRTLLEQTFDYSGYAILSDKGTYLGGVIQSWQTGDLNPTWNIESGEYKVCAFIDFNNNGQLDNLEPVHSSQYTAPNGFLPIDSWLPY